MPRAAFESVWQGASPLHRWNREMTPSVVEHVSRIEIPTLTTTQELLLRSVSCDVFRCQRKTSRNCDGFSARNVRATCGWCARLRSRSSQSTMRCMSDLSHDVLVCQIPDSPTHRTRLRNQEFFASSASASASRRSVHFTSRHTICPSAVQVLTSGLLACLVLDQQTTETTFVSFPADRAFGALTRAQ